MRSSDPYFDWLMITIGISRNLPGRDYKELVNALHNIQFRPKMAIDRNRGTDGLELRVEFINEHGPWGSATNRGPCTMLEFLVALSKRMSFLTYGSGDGRRTEDHFWTLIRNLGLDKCTDDKWYAINGQFFVEDAVYRVTERQYNEDGSGGLFPLRHPHENQRYVEIWYQMNAWLIENCQIGTL